MVRYSCSVTPHLNPFSNLLAVAMWNSSIREAANHGYAQKALILFRQMKRSGAKPDNSTYPCVAKACAKLAHLLQSQIIHAHVVKSWFQLYDI
ncbi:hypothetical protein L6164_006543 [Bauhinia variegata]|uniref:Uncharacterized protein n=1 Tax=Bauhinia variegata TaxID=167791 RepID=A0ACB9PTZ6_BAUVA|nr:hypothetical protein L6164_006543 [Bauhinia variegata]